MWNLWKLVLVLAKVVACWRLATAPLFPRDRVLLEHLVPRSLEPQWTAPHTVRGQYFSCQASMTPCYYHFSSFKWAHIQDTWSVAQLVLTTLQFSKMPQWSAYLLFFLAHSSLSVQQKKMITIYFFLLATCLPISLKEQMPEVSRRAVNCISLQSQVPLRSVIHIWRCRRS